MTWMCTLRTQADRYRCACFPELWWLHRTRMIGTVFSKALPTPVEGSYITRTTGLQMKIPSLRCSWPCSQYAWQEGCKTELRQREGFKSGEHKA